MNLGDWNSGFLELGVWWAEQDKSPTLIYLTYAKKPFKYYDSKEVGGWGQKIFFDYLQDMVDFIKNLFN